MNIPPFFRFLLVGLANTAIGYGVILIFQYGFSAGYVLSNALGYAIGALVSYFLNKKFTFRSTHKHRDAMPRFVLTVASAYLINLAVLKITISLWQIPAAVAQGVASVAYTLSFYIISKYFVFQEPPGRS